MTDQTSRSADSTLVRFLDSEAAGGVLLIAAAALALLAANAPTAHLYHDLLHAHSQLVLSPKLGPMTPHLWINDGLMALFFLLVGLEIKREFLGGRLATWECRRLPVIAAAAGMALPALLYLFVAGGEPGLSRGWAIPAATDIAFAVGVLALLGTRAPASLKLFLVTVAIVDDLGAVLIIALAYTDALNTLALGVGAFIFLALYVMSKSGVRAIWPYLLGGGLLWYAILLSGVHATVAGVLTAMTVPIVNAPGGADSPDSTLHRLEHRLARPVAFLIVPLFGFVNAGVDLGGIGLGGLFSPLPLAIAAGLFVGKQAGIFGAVWLCVRFRLAAKPEGASWLQIYGVSILCGIGFTMSLFIAALAFPGSPQWGEEAKIGILLGSFLSALAGFAVLRLAPRPPQTHEGALPDGECAP